MIKKMKAAFAALIAGALALACPMAVYADQTPCVALGADLSTAITASLIMKSSFSPK